MSWHQGRNSLLTGQAMLPCRGNMEEFEEARDLYRKAAQRWADYGFVLEEGQANLGLARCLIASATVKPPQNTSGGSSDLL